MNIDDFNKVTVLVQKKAMLEQAQKDIDRTLKCEIEDYWCSLSQHGDGTGWRVKLAGCGIATKILEASAGVVEKEIGLLIAELRSLGVGVGV